MKIGIYGGSFNPPHNMHLKMATSLIENGYLDKVIFIPTSNHYPKNGLATNKERLEMLKIMTEDYNNLEVSDFEMQEKLVHTYQTLDYFKEKYLNDTIYFILGSDLLKDFDTWKNYSYILESYKILVTLRNQDEKKELKELPYYNENIFFTNIELKSLSSTEIRNSIENNDSEFLEENLNPKVLTYIRKNDLYKGNKTC